MAEKTRERKNDSRLIADNLRREAEERLRSWGISPDQRCWDLLDIYLGDVLEYNRKVNLTAAKDIGELVRRHALDALAALAPLKKRLRGRTPHLADIGSGGGFIGIGIKIGWPEARMTLVESIYKKHSFLTWTSMHLPLRGLEAVHSRAERLPEGGFDAVMARAVAPLPEAAALALRLARPGGWAFVYQSKPAQADDPALSKVGGDLEQSYAYRLPREDKERYLAIFRRPA